MPLSSPQGRFMANRHVLRPPSGHRQTLAPLSKVFFLAAIRISSHTHPFLCGCSVTYKRYLYASIRQLCEFMRQLSASIRRPSESHPARYAARFGRSETASAEKRQIEHVKITKKDNFRLKNDQKRPQKASKICTGENHFPPSFRLGTVCNHLVFHSITLLLSIIFPARKEGRGRYLAAGV
jgi:hypothetical protein